LKEVADIKADADKGREMTEREYRLTRELFDFLWLPAFGA
jgi:hypothetical protein